jgi:FtsP/CotA-like multicopper oxidase with cupredoxin domain
MACDPDYKFHIDDHTMTVIEVDGINHQPKTVDQIDIFAGEFLVVVSAVLIHGNSFPLKVNAIHS